VESDGVHHRPGQQRRRRAREDPDGDAEGADDLEAGREVGPKVRRPRKEGEVDGDDLVGEGVGVLELVQPVVDDQQRSDDAHRQHAQIGPHRVLEEVQHWVRERVLPVGQHGLLRAHSLGALLRHAQQCAPEPVRHAVRHLPEEDSDGALTSGGDLGPLEHPLHDGHPPAAQHQPVEAQASVVPPEREAPDLGRAVRTRDAIWVLEQRLACDGVEDVVGRQVSVHLGRVSQLELSALVRHHVTHAVDPWVTLHLQVVVDLNRVSEAELLSEGRLFEHVGVGHHADALVHDVGGQLDARLEENRVGSNPFNGLAAHQLDAAHLEPRARVGGGSLVKAGQNGGRHVYKSHPLVGVGRQDLTCELDADRARTHNDDGLGPLELGGSAGPRELALRQRLLRLGGLDGIGVRRADGQDQIVELDLLLHALGVLHDDGLLSGSGHGSDEQLVARGRQLAGELAEKGRLHEAAERPGGVLEVALEVNEGDLDVAAPSELALSRETAEGSAHNDDMLG